MMPFLKIKKEDIIIVLDIGSASVGGAIVSIKNKNKPIVLYIVRKQIKINESINFSRLLSLMSNTLDLVLTDLVRISKISPKKIFCILSSPWYTSATHLVKIKKEFPFTFTRKMMDNIINKELYNIKKYAVKKNNIVDGKPQIIDIQNIQIKLNGYETNNPYNKKIKLAEMAFFVSIGDENTTKLIEDSVSKVFHNVVYFSSFSLASFITIRDIFNESNFLFIDITGEVTDISIIKNNILLENTTFPLGKNFLIRRIASKFNTTIEEAESLFCMFNEGSSDNITNNKLKKVLDSTKKEWTTATSVVLSDFSMDYSIPNSVFIIADNKIQKWFADAVRGGEEFDQFTLTNDRFEIKILKEKLIGEFCSFKEKDIPKDLFLMIEVIFAERILSL